MKRILLVLLMLIISSTQVFPGSSGRRADYQSGRTAEYYPAALESTDYIVGKRAGNSTSA